MLDKRRAKKGIAIMPTMPVRLGSISTSNTVSAGVSGKAAKRSATATVSTIYSSVVKHRLITAIFFFIKRWASYSDSSLLPCAQLARAASCSP